MDVRARAGIVLAAASAFACESERTLFVAFPPLGDAQAVIVSVASATRRNLAAAELTPGASLLLPIEELGTATVSVLAYRVPLDVLGLAAGPLDVAVEGEEGLAVPRPDRALYARVLGGVAGAWDDGTNVRDDGLAETRLAGRRPPVQRCVRPTLQVHELATPSDPDFLVALDHESALLATEDGAFYRVTAGGVTALADLPTGMPHGAAFSEIPDTVWLAGSRGRVGLLDLQRGRYLASATSSSGLAFSRVVHDSRLQLLALSSEGSLEQLDSGVWTTLREAPGDVKDWRRDLVSTGPGEVIAVGVSGAGVVRVNEDGLVEESLGADVAPVSVTARPGLGALVGTFEGRIFRESMGAWAEVPGSPISLVIAALVPFNGGFVAGGGAGLIAEHYDGHGFCEPIQTSHAIVKHMVAIDGALLITGDRPAASTRPALVTVLSVLP